MDIIFYDAEHENFYKGNASKCKQDPYNKSVIYLLGLTEETRKHFAELYNIEKGEINVKEINREWQTGTTTIITRLAFNLFNGYTGTEQENDAKYYAVDNIFYNRRFASYFWQAVKIRFEMETPTEHNKAKERVQGLQAYLKEFEEMHKEDADNINKQSFNAFLLVIKSQLQDIADIIK